MIRTPGPTRRDDDYDDEDDYEPRRRRGPRDGDPTGGLIPLKNGYALAAYYCGVFGLIPFLGRVDSCRRVPADWSWG